MAVGDVGHFVDKAKVVAVASLFAIVLGFAGAFALAAAMATLLSQWLVWPAALAITAVACMALAAIALWIGVKPSAHAKLAASNKAIEGEDQAVESAMSQLTDLPMEMAKKIITERPIAALAVFSGFGVLIARRPELAVRLVERLITRFT